MTWLIKQIEWMKGFLSEEGGKASHKRLIGVMVVVTFLAAYMKNVVTTATLPDMPVTWAMLIAAILGLAIAANKFQKLNGNGNGSGHSDTGQSH